MPQNKIWYQAGLSLTQYTEQYGTELTRPPLSDSAPQGLLPGIGVLRLRSVDADERERFALPSDQLCEGTVATAPIQR